MRKSMVSSALLLLAAALSACGTTPAAPASGPPPAAALSNYSPYTSGVSACPRWMPGDTTGDCGSASLPPGQQIGAVPTGR